MSLTFFCSLCLGLSVLLLAVAVWKCVHALRLSRRPGNETDGDRLRGPLQLFLVWFFAAAVLIFAPVYGYDYLAHEPPFSRVFKCLFLSVHNTMRLFILDGEFDIIEDFVTGAVDTGRLSAVVAELYSLYAVVVYVAAPVVTAGFVLSFFRSVTARLRFRLLSSRNTYHLSELNEQSLALAENILSEDPTGKPLIVFYDVYDSGEEADGEMITRAKRLGALCFSKDIAETELERPPRKHRKCRTIERRFYMIGEDEDENVKQALTLIDRCRGNARYDTPSTRFYVFSRTEDSEVLLDCVDRGRMKVRRVNEIRNLILNTLMQEPVFDNAYPDPATGRKQLNILVVGCGKYGMELVRALCWCGQLPGYDLTIHVSDKRPDIESRLKGVAPELMQYSGVRAEGEPYYRICLHPGVDVEGSGLADLVREAGRITAAFVTLGDDRVNVGTAMALRRECGRAQIRLGYAIPRLYAVVYSPLKNQILRQGAGLRCLGREEYGIRFIGDLNTRYSLAIIGQDALEAEGLHNHLSWLERRKTEIRAESSEAREIERQIEENRLAYERFEYYRRASMARAVHRAILLRMGLLPENAEAEKIGEHNRWSAFMRSEGFVYDPAVRDNIAKTHPDLIPYGQLSEIDRDKDALLKDLPGEESEKADGRPR